MITFHPECGESYTNGQHGYVLVENVTSTDPGGLSVQLSISHTDFGQTVGSTTNVTVNAGSFSPTGSGTLNTCPSANSTAGSKSTNSGFDNFDQNVDDSLGPYISLSPPASWPQLLPSMPNSTLQNFGAGGDINDGFPSLEGHKRSLVRRWNPFGAITTFVEEKVSHLPAWPVKQILT